MPKSIDPPFATLPPLSARTTIQRSTAKPPVAASQSFMATGAAVRRKMAKDYRKYFPSPVSIPAVSGHKLRLVGFVSSRAI
ncbi:hypothetical protein TorRG33x02_140530 [Trema orientale]|uniref:Uncharacterized protein n=1 Tax=Trema orientale TaxID=63057 RepID=A0A2P5EXE7_TREOI|nr:hypothetical protein TorRG33x02_140530 [Trema orientale]